MVTAQLLGFQKRRAVGRSLKRHERITSFENAISKGAEQLRLVCLQLGGRPISLWDSEYGCASFVNQTADIALEERRSLADKLMRLRPLSLLVGTATSLLWKRTPQKAWSQV